MEIFKEHPVLCTFGAIGALKLGHLFYRGLKFVKKYLLPGGYNLLTRYGHCWAVINGATGEIGKAYTMALANMGFDLLLTGRMEEKLKELEKEVSKLNPKTKVRTLQIEFGKEEPKEIIRKLEAISQDLDIGFLVNVAGTNHGIEYQLYPLENIKELIDATIIGTCLMTQIMATKMMKRKERSGILNISSILASGKSPFCSVYSSTKAFVDSYAKCLQVEVKDKIDITTVHCGDVITQKKSRDLTIFQSSAENVARVQLQHQGVYGSSQGYWGHSLQKKCWSNPIMNWQKKKAMNTVNVHYQNEWQNKFG